MSYELKMNCHKKKELSAFAKNPISHLANMQSLLNTKKITKTYKISVAVSNDKLFFPFYTFAGT